MERRKEERKAGWLTFIDSSQELTLSPLDDVWSGYGSCVGRLVSSVVMVLRGDV